VDDEKIKKIIEDTYDDSKENTLKLMVSQWYKKKIRWTAILFSAYCCFFHLLAIASAVLFFQVEQPKYQMMYVALFLFFMQRSALVKTIGWQRVNKHSVDREIKRLELRISQLNESLENKVT
jgi:hypothetical protein